MELKHPSEKFIVFLLTSRRAKKHDNDWVRKHLEHYNLPTAGDDYMDQLRERVKPPRPFFPEEEDHEESVRFLQSWGIESMHRNGDDISGVNALLLNHTMRRQVEVLLLGGVPVGEIAERLGSRFETVLEPETVRLFAYYYHDVRALSLDEWAELHHHYEDGHDREMALTCGPNMALHRLGFQAMIETKTIMRRIQQSLYFDYMAIDKMPINKTTVAMKTRIASVAIKVDERLSQSDVALREVLDQFKKFNMKQDEGKVASLDEITSQGSHSQSGQLEEDHG